MGKRKNIGFNKQKKVQNHQIELNMQISINSWIDDNPQNMAT